MINTRPCRLALLSAVILSAVGAQVPTGATSARTSDPQPEDATRAILAAFDTFRVVAIGDHHGSQDLQNFVLSLIKHRAFPNTVNDIVVEGTNGLLQATLDRYIAGDDVPLAEARRLWRDGTNPAASNDFHAQLFPLVRRINQTLPSTTRLRVVAGEDGIDWAHVTPAIYQQYIGRREEHIASVVGTEVLARRRKALMVYGGAHVQHSIRENAMGYIDAKYRGFVFVVFPYVGARQRARCGLPASVDGVAFDAKMASWPVPSLARAKGTWLEDFAKSAAWSPVQTMLAAQLGRSMVDSTLSPVDAYLYLGPPHLLIAAQPSAFGLIDADYVAELRRRQVAVGQSGNDPRTDPSNMRGRDGDAFLCELDRTR